MSPAGAVALTLLVLAAAGALPTAALVGPRVIALPLLPLAGSVLCALAGASTFALPGTLLLWFVLWSLAAAVVSAGVLVSRSRSRASPPALTDMRALRRALLDSGRRAAGPLLAALPVLAAVGWALRTIRVPNVGFDTRAIWLLHAHWLTHGHAFALAALRNPFDVVSHPSYPPLVSSVMALSWRVSGSGADRTAVVMVAALNACALFAGGWGVVEVARRAAIRTGATARGQAGLLALGALVAVLVVLVAGGVLGTFGTNGYADPLWSLAAVVAVLYGLMLEPTARNLGVVAIVLGVAGLTKVEGTAMAIVLVLATSSRCLLRRDRVGGLRNPALATVLGVLALLGWPVATVILGVPKDVSISGVRDGSLWHRAQATFDAAAPHLHVVEVAAVAALAGLVLLRQRRARLGLGNDLWAWGILGAAILVLGGAYVFGPGDVELWLATSVDRTTIFVALLGWWIVAVWAFCGVSSALE